jgi:hypothetical protein
MNPPIPEKYSVCVASQRKYLSFMDYEFIDEIKSIQLLNEANEKFNGVNSIKEFIDNPYAASEYLRCYLLSLSPFTLYLDSDVEIVQTVREPSLPQFNENPAMEFYESTGMHNVGVIWNGNRTDVFEELCRYWFAQNQVQSIMGSIGKSAKENNFIRYSPSWFNHHLFTTHKSHGEK